MQNKLVFGMKKKSCYECETYITTIIEAPRRLDNLLDTPRGHKYSEMVGYKLMKKSYLTFGMVIYLQTHW